MTRAEKGFAVGVSDFGLCSVLQRWLVWQNLISLPQRVADVSIDWSGRFLTRCFLRRFGVSAVLSRTQQKPVSPTNRFPDKVEFIAALLIVSHG